MVLLTRLLGMGVKIKAAHEDNTDLWEGIIPVQSFIRSSVNVCISTFTLHVSVSFYHACCFQLYRNCWDAYIKWMGGSAGITDILLHG